MSRAIFLAAITAALVATTAFAFYEGKDNAVVNLDGTNFEKKVTNSDKLWIVEFYAPWCGHCKQLAPEWQKAAKALKGIAGVGAVDADKHRDLGSKHGVDGFPTIKIFNAGKATDYDGGRTASDIVDTVMAQAEKVAFERAGIKHEEKKEDKKQAPASGFYDNSDVIELTDDDFEKEVFESKEPVLVEFYAPWCGHCKQLTPAWKEAASLLQGQVKLAAVDATAQTKYSGKFGVQGFPTIKFFAPGSEEPTDYNGGRSTEAIVSWAEEKAAEYPSSGTAGPAVGQIENQEALDKLCSAKANLCVVYILPHVIDTGASGRNAYIEAFSAAQKQLRARKVAAGWIVGGEHTKFEESFGIYGSYPTFVAWNPKNKRYSTFSGQFSEAKVLGHIKGILDGKVSVSKMKDGQEVAPLSKGVELWDGKDYVAPVEEEY